MHSSRLALLPGLFLAILFSFWTRGLLSQEPGGKPVEDKLRPPRMKMLLQGAGSCASMACHNADPMLGTPRGEYGLALEREAKDSRLSFKDKHAQAFDVLFDKRSKVIERNLKNLASLTQAHPESNPLCLRCHVHPAIEQVSAREINGVKQFRLEDGVSCEACHGPAEHWLAAHFRPGWKEKDSGERLAHGMYDTRSLTGRIQLCIDCHVGANDMEVNHDLIAAGHPRLNFEFSSFHSMLHKHWDHAKDKDPVTGSLADFETGAWALGQMYAAKASLKLLADRAGDDKRPWPEFAEYDCFSCHHDLRAENWRQKKGAAAAGGLPWSSWYHNMLPSAVVSVRGNPESARLPELKDLIKEIQQEMEKRAPDRQVVAAAAQKAVGFLDTALSQREPVAWDKLARRVVASIGARELPWDEAAQGYLALSALDRARPQAKLPPLKSLSLLPEPLRFPHGYDSPEKYHPQAAQQLLNELKRQLLD